MQISKVVSLFIYPTFFFSFIFQLDHNSLVNKNKRQTHEFNSLFFNFVTYVEVGGINYYKTNYIFIPFFFSFEVQKKEIKVLQFENGKIHLSFCADMFVDATR